MAETYAQRKSAVLRQVRTLKSALRTLDTQVEKVQREADRLSHRKTMITPDSLLHIIDDFSSLAKAANAADYQLGALSQVAASYL